MSDWNAAMLVAWVVAVVCVIVALEDRGWTWRRLMKVSVWQVLVSGFVGIILGLVIAPPLATVRPLPPPIIERVPIHTDDVLDTGTACVYVWDGLAFVWERTHFGLPLGKPCPPKPEAQRRWNEALRAPSVVRLGGQ